MAVLVLQISSAPGILLCIIILKINMNIQIESLLFFPPLFLYAISNVFISIKVHPNAK